MVEYILGIITGMLFSLGILLILGYFIKIPSIRK